MRAVILISAVMIWYVDGTALGSRKACMPDGYRCGVENADAEGSFPPCCSKTSVCKKDENRGWGKFCVSTTTQQQKHQTGLSRSACRKEERNGRMFKCCRITYVCGKFQKKWLIKRTCDRDVCRLRELPGKCKRKRCSTALIKRQCSKSVCNQIKVPGTCTRRVCKESEQGNCYKRKCSNAWVRRTCERKRNCEARIVKKTCVRKVCEKKRVSSGGTKKCQQMLIKKKCQKRICKVRKVLSTCHRPKCEKRYFWTPCKKQVCSPPPKICLEEVCKTVQIPKIVFKKICTTHGRKRRAGRRAQSSSRRTQSRFKRHGARCRMQRRTIHVPRRKCRMKSVACTNQKKRCQKIHTHCLKAVQSCKQEAYECKKEEKQCRLKQYACDVKREVCKILPTKAPSAEPICKKVRYDCSSASPLEFCSKEKYDCSFQKKTCRDVKSTSCPLKPKKCEVESYACQKKKKVCAPKKFDCNKKERSCTDVWEPCLKRKNECKKVPVDCSYYANISKPRFCPDVKCSPLSLPLIQELPGNKTMS